MVRDRAGTLEVRSGARDRVRLRFAEEDGRYYVIPSAPDSAWWRRAIREGGAWVRAEDTAERECSGEILAAPERIEHIRSLFRAKYGASDWDRYFSGASRALCLDPTRPRHPLDADARLREEFDSVAPGYDRQLSGHPIERYLKERAGALVGTSLAGADPLLEIGPGTGYHTLRLLAAGHRIVAVDVSGRMTVELVRRARAERLANGLTARTGRLRDLAEVLGDLPDGTFGGAFSMFGPFNLERDLTPAAAALARLVRPGGRLAFTSIGRPGLAPMAWELALGRPRAAFCRVRGSVPPDAFRYPLELFLKNPTEWDRLLAPRFHRVATLAVSVLAPPFDSDRLTRFLGPDHGRRGRRLDERLSRHPGLAGLAEWSYLEYVRSSNGTVTSAAPEGR